MLERKRQIDDDQRPRCGPRNDLAVIDHLVERGGNRGGPARHDHCHAVADEHAIDARGIDEPEIKGVLGWELLKKFEQIYFDYAKKRLAISTAKSAYMPDPAQLIARIPLVKYTGACAVRGAVDGKQGLILIDPAGDFEVATDSGETISSVQLDANFMLPASSVVKSPGGTRIGARLLEKFKITICPQEGMIYFEKPEAGKEE